MLNLSLFNSAKGKGGKQKETDPPNPMSPAALVSAVCKDKVSVSVSVLGRLDGYDSKFLGWDDETQAFYITPVRPSRANFSLVPSKTSVRFNFEFRNLRRRFRSLYAGIWKLNGLNTLRFFAPEHIETIQRRDNYRVSPKIGQPVMVQFRYERMETSEAIDISGGGVSFSSSKRVVPGSKFSVRIELPNERSIETDVETCGYDVFSSNIGKRSTLLPYKVRAKFSHLNLGDSQLIGHYVAKRQRDPLRHAF